MTRRALTLYGRDGCHLCDEARQMLLPLVAEAGDVDLKEIDIDSDDRLFKAYLERIPVIELDGVEIGELVPDERELRMTLLNTST